MDSPRSPTFWTLRTEGTTFARPSTAGGQFRLLDPATALTVVPPLFDAARKRHVGEVTRSAKWFEHIFGDRPGGKGPRRVFTVVHESADGRADGFARYRINDAWPGGIAANTLEVLDLYGLDDEVEAALWQFLVDIDLVANVKGIGRPIDDPLRWRLADPRRLQITGSPTTSGCASSIPPSRSPPARTRPTTTSSSSSRIRSSRRTRAGGRSTPRATGRRFVVPTPSPISRCRRRSSALSISGGVSATTLERANRITEIVPGAIERADRFFASTPAPWCRTDF